MLNFDIFIILWYPVFVPQITGDPKPPGAVIEKLSVVQSPIASPIIQKNSIFLSFLRI